LISDSTPLCVCVAVPVGSDAVMEDKSDLSCHMYMVYSTETEKGESEHNLISGNKPSGVVKLEMTDESVISTDTFSNKI
jgi:hypothetical protein